MPDDDDTKVQLALLRQRLDALETDYKDLHERIGGRGRRDAGLEGRQQKLETDVDIIGGGLREVRKLITGNGGGKPISAEFMNIRIEAKDGFTEVKAEIQKLKDYNTENPSLTWLLKHRTGITVGVGVVVWIAIMTVYNLGLLPFVAKMFGFSLP